MSAKQNPRPPKVWFSQMWSKVAVGYPRRAKETLEHYRGEINRIVAGIWWKLPEATRHQLIEKYERNATPARALNPKRLPCPVCGVPNVLGPSSVYMRCSGCGRPLMRINVRNRR